MTLNIPKKLRQLEKFLYSDAVNEDAMLLSELDGFIAGIVICPSLIVPSEWIPVIWAGEEPVFDNEAQAQNIMSILMGYYNDENQKAENPTDVVNTLRVLTVAIKE